MRTLKLILSGWQSVGLVVFFMLFFLIIYHLNPV